MPVLIVFFQIWVTKFLAEFEGMYSSFTVGNDGIFVQLLMRINWKWIPVESMLMQIFIFAMMLLIEMEVTDNYIHLIFKVKVIQLCQHCQLCVLRKTLMLCGRHGWCLIEHPGMTLTDHNALLYLIVIDCSRAALCTAHTTVTDWHERLSLVKSLPTQYSVYHSCVKKWTFWITLKEQDLKWRVNLTEDPKPLPLIFQTGISIIVKENWCFRSQISPFLQSFHSFKSTVLRANGCAIMKILLIKIVHETSLLCPRRTLVYFWSLKHSCTCGSDK